ncbi:MAG TPA: hypothetical protein VHV81_17510 [Steroidobacteraceae bacterium]|jgi:hippurate hydrolase|nr:hypothetical protein [Steroidobacteraceae bacterium]
MNRRAPLCILTISLLAPTVALSDKLDAVVNGEVGNLVDIYKDIHEHAELSHHEERTAALAAGELRKAGYTVTEHVG